MRAQLLLPTLHQNLFLSPWASPEGHRTVTEPRSSPRMSWVGLATVASVGREQDRACQLTEPPKTCPILLALQIPSGHAPQLCSSITKINLFSL